MVDPGPSWKDAGEDMGGCDGKPRMARCWEDIIALYFSRPLQIVLLKTNLHMRYLFSREMLRFAKIAKEWMLADDNNIIAIHCKGGKGRTGTMICIWLIESGTFEQASVGFCRCTCAFK